jgi:hypothetical protein
MNPSEFREDMSKDNIPRIPSNQNLVVFNVGWVGSNIPFSIGKVSESFRDKLERIIINNNSSSFQSIVWRYRGEESCPICHCKNLLLGNGADVEVLGSSYLFIPHHSDSNTYFISPSLIHHFITYHNYSPPSQFIDSVIAINENSEFNGDDTYRTHLGSILACS